VRSLSHCWLGSLETRRPLQFGQAKRAWVMDSGAVTLARPPVSLRARLHCTGCSSSHWRRRCSLRNSTRVQSLRSRSLAWRRRSSWPALIFARLELAARRGAASERNGQKLTVLIQQFPRPQPTGNELSLGPHFAPFAARRKSPPPPLPLPVPLFSPNPAKKWPAHKEIAIASA